MNTDYFIGGINLLVLVFGLVEFTKKIGLKGPALTVCSLLVGMLAGAAWQFVTGGVPTSLAGWITTAVFGLAVGLAASGVYDFLRTMQPPAG